VTTNVLPELALGGAELVRRTVNQPVAEGLNRDAVDAVLRQSFLTLDIVRASRDRLLRDLQDRGLDPAALQAASRIALQTLDALADANGRLLSLSLDAAQRQEVERQQKLVEEIRRSFTEWTGALSRPWPSLDWQQLAADAGADAEAGRMIRVEGFGDLFPSHADEA
jgi:hypothetical protein